MGETSLAVQWVRLATSTAGDIGLIPDAEAKFLHAYYAAGKNKIKNFHHQPPPPSWHFSDQASPLPLLTGSLGVGLAKGQPLPPHLCCSHRNTHSCPALSPGEYLSSPKPPSKLLPPSPAL